MTGLLSLHALAASCIALREMADLVLEFSDFLPALSSSSSSNFPLGDLDEA